MAEDAVALTVLVPTIGRGDLLAACLSSVASCRPPAAEVLLVDQSGTDEVRDTAARFANMPVRILACERRGPAMALNLGLRAAAHDVVAVTNDDCTVRTDWVAVAHREATRTPGAIVTGSVLPAGDSTMVPSVKVDPVPRDFTGEVALNALYGGNMVLPRHAVLALGGFDERPGMRLAAEDNDFCYRWLRAGRPLRYDPELVVWHHDWRTPQELARRHVEYARGNGVLYAKYLLRGDVRVLRMALRELSWGMRGLAAGVVRGRPRWQDPRRGILRGLPVGLVIGVRDALVVARRRGR